MIGTWTLARKIAGGFGIGVFSLILLAGLSFWSAGLLTQLGASGKWWHTLTKFLEGAKESCRC